MSQVGPLLRTPGVRGVLVSSLVARLPIGALGLLLLLRARELGFSYAVAGLAAGALALGVAAAPPVLGRLIDRHGARAVLVPTATAGAAVLAALASPLSASAPALVVLGALAGAVHPPVSSVVRVMWRRMLDDPAERHAAMSFEAALVEVSYLLGPLVLVGIFGAWSPSAGLLATAAAVLAGTVAFALQPVIGRHGGATRAAGEPAARLGGALASPVVRTLLMGQAALGLSFGALEVAVTAFAADHGARAATGPLLAVWGVGSMLGGLVAATRPAPADPARRLRGLLAAMALLDVALVAAPSVPLLAAGLLLAGSAIAPSFALLYGIAADGGPAGAATEAQAWLTTGIGLGIAAGSALAGVAADGAGAAGAFGLGAAGAAGAAVLVMARSATLQMPAPVPAAAG